MPLRLFCKFQKVIDIMLEIIFISRRVIRRIDCFAPCIRSSFNGNVIIVIFLVIF